MNIIYSLLSRIHPAGPRHVANIMIPRFVSSAAFLALFWGFAASGGHAHDAPAPFRPAYNETLAEKYVWLAQATYMSAESLKNWTCGNACRALPEVAPPVLVTQSNPYWTDLKSFVARWGADSGGGPESCVFSVQGSTSLLDFLVDDLSLVEQKCCGPELYDFMYGKAPGGICGRRWDEGEGGVVRP